MEEEVSRFDYDTAAKLLDVPRATLPAVSTAAAAAAAPSGMTRFVPLSDQEWLIVCAVLPKLPVPKPQGFMDRIFIDAVLWWIAGQVACLPEPVPG